MHKRLSPLFVAGSLLLGMTGLFGALAGCTPTNRAVNGSDMAVDDNNNGNDDQGVIVVDQDGDVVSGPCDDQHPCATGSRCFNGSCITDNGTCMSDDDCENDSYCDCVGGGGADAGPCMGGICVPWGTGPKGTFDPDCQSVGFSATAFKAPVVTCHWTPAAGESSAVLMTPLAVDLDGDSKPEIIFSTYEQSGALVAMHGATCKTYFEKANADILQCSHLAAADLDGDKIPEIIAVNNSQLVVVYDHLGNLLATSPNPYMRDFQGDDCQGPAVADVDNDGIPEILVSAQVLRYHKGNNRLQELWNKAPSTGPTAHWGSLSLFADLDGDGKPEAVTGLKVYDGLTGADKTPTAFAQLDSQVGAYPQVADFNGDKKPDVLLVQSDSGKQTVSIIDFANNKIIFGPFKVAGGGWGGPATVADFDGDGVPDFGTAGPDHYYVYALKCVKNPKPADCQGPDPGILWERVTHDASSGGTASSVFDFNGDGKAEVVYRDECWMRVMNGADGKTVFAQQITSGTALEMPIVADVDNDGHADLVVPSDQVQGANYCQNIPEGQTGQQFTGATQGVYVLRDPMNRWVPSRAIWNQHTYHITNVNDDSTIPKKETPNWLSWNDYRQNVQGLVGSPKAQGDLTGGKSTGIDTQQADCTMAWTLRANLCNRGAAPVPAGIPGTFYSSDPSKPNPVAICTGQSTMILNPGDCETLQCDWKNPPQVPTDLWFRGDDDGTGKKPQTECKNDNDTLFISQALCGRIG